MSIYTPDKMTDVQLVAAILGKKEVDIECNQLAQYMAFEGPAVIDVGSNPAAFAKRLARIEAAVELGRRLVIKRQLRDATTLSTPEDVLALMEPMYIGLEREVFYCLCLNTKNHLKKMVEVSIGSLNASIVHPRELFREAIKVSSASVVLVHNHPSGDPTPSGADLQLTRRLVKAGDILGIELLDHVVIGGEGRHVSLREQGVL